MLEIIQFLLQLFTDPVGAIATIVLLVLTIGGIRWFANRPVSSLPLDSTPEAILRHRLKFGDEDLKYNRSSAISPKQMQRIRKEFLILLVVYAGLIVFMGFIFVSLFWDELFRWDPDLFLIGALGFMGLFFLFLVGVAIFHLRRYIMDLKTKKVLLLVSPLIFEEHEGEYMGFKFRVHQYKMIVKDARLPKPLSLHIGSLSEDDWHKVQKLEKQFAILYVATGVQDYFHSKSRQMYRM